MTVNSDNMTVSDTWVGKEFELLFQEYGLTKPEAELLLKNAVKNFFPDKMTVKEEAVSGMIKEKKL